MTRALSASTVQLAVLVCLGCSSVAAPIGPGQPSAEVRLVEQAEYDEMRRSDKYAFSEPLGDVAVTEACTSGNVDEQCVNAARERLRNSAADRGANLVLLHPASALQSYPPRYALSGVMYEIRVRN
jgi:hypothetical protein